MANTIVDYGNITSQASNIECVLDDQKTNVQNAIEELNSNLGDVIQSLFGAPKVKAVTPTTGYLERDFSVTQWGKLVFIRTGAKIIKNIPSEGEPTTILCSGLPKPIGASVLWRIQYSNLVLQTVINSDGTLRPYYTNVTGNMANATANNYLSGTICYLTDDDILNDN